MSPIKTFLPIVGIAMLGGCTTDRGHRDAFSERDSAGVRIAESQASMWGQGDGWKVTSEPSLSIGQEEGDSSSAFGDVVGAVSLNDGSVVVADKLSGLLSYFDGAGKFRFSRGGLGGGPGEMADLSALSSCGSSSVFAFDRQTHRVQQWNSDGVLQKEFELVEPTKARVPYRTACGSSGFVGIGWGDLSALSSNRTNRFYTQSAPVWLFDTAGKVVRELGSFVQSERVFVVNQNGGGSSGPHPLGRSTVLAVTDSGVYIGTSEQFDVRVYGLDGKLKEIFRAPSHDSAYTKEFLDKYRATTLEGEAASRKKLVEKSGWLMPSGIPAYSEMIVDPGYNIWLHRFRAPWEDSNDWAVFGSNGRYLGDVATPRGLNIREIGSDYVLGIVSDSLGVQRVERHKLDRNGA
jgi:hypothetical protein